MSAACRACLRPLEVAGPAGMHPACVRKLFGSRRVPRIDVDPAKLHLFGLEMTGRTTLSGVQRKVALSEHGGALTVEAGGTSFILKPQEGRFPEIPENEHLSMRLAELAGLEIPALGLVELTDGSLALLVRRFDRLPDGRRVPMEDFCQLAELPPSEKYESSAERCSKIVESYVDEALVDQRLLFRLFLVSWWLGNGDLHLKNVSLLTRERGRPRLSPTYDLVNTSIVIPGDTLALPIQGKRANLKPNDWIEYGAYCGLPRAVVADEARRVHEIEAESLAFVERSFMTVELKQAYAAGLAERSAELAKLAAEAARGTRLDRDKWNPGS